MAHSGGWSQRAKRLSAEASFVWPTTSCLPILIEAGKYTFSRLAIAHSEIEVLS